MDNRTTRMVFSLSLNALVILFGIFVIFTAGSKAYTLGHNIFNEEAMTTNKNSREVVVTIRENITESQLADILYEKGLIRDKNVFKLQVKLSDYKGKFVAGTYTLNTSLKPTEMMQILCGLDDGKEK